MADRSTDSDGRTRVLADGASIPSLGLGVWQIPNGPECVNAVRWALELGYRHIDTAQAYGNEESVGRALRDSGVARDEVFLTTKFYPAHRDPAAQAVQSLRRLGVDQIDLYIVHWPQGGPTWAWPGMEKAQRRGRTFIRSASPTSASASSEQVLGDRDQPAGGQPGACSARSSTGRHYLRRASSSASPLRPTAPSEPAGTSRIPTVAEIAERVGRTPAQVLLRWCIQRQTVVISKSTHRERIEENGRLFDFKLTDDDMASARRPRSNRWDGQGP